MAFSGFYSSVYAHAQVAYTEAALYVVILPLLITNLLDNDDGQKQTRYVARCKLRNYSHWFIRRYVSLDTLVDVQYCSGCGLRLNPSM